MDLDDTTVRQTTNFPLLSCLDSMFFSTFFGEEVFGLLQFGMQSADHISFLGTGLHLLR